MRLQNNISLIKCVVGEKHQQRRKRNTKQKLETDVLLGDKNVNEIVNF